MNNKIDTAKTGNRQINCRQLCFFCAFLLPLGKMLEAPRIFAKYASGDLLFPALLQFILQGCIFSLLLFAAAKAKEPLLNRLEKIIGKGWMGAIYFLFCAYFIFASLLPLLDLDKFCYAAFFDTSPTTFAFAPFFFVSAFLCMKSLKAYGRLFDLSLLLFLPSFLALTIFSVGSCDFSLLLPLFEQPLASSLQAVRHTFSFFSDSAIFLFLLNGYTYQKGDAKKILPSFAAGAAFTLVFLTLFFTTFDTMSQSEHYAFIKISQFFSALKTTGRIDLLFAYLLTILLIFYTCLPLQLAVYSFTHGLRTEQTLLPSVLLNVGLFIFVLFGNNAYNGFYEWISTRLALVFVIFSYLIPLMIVVIVSCGKNKKDKGRVALNALSRNKKEKNHG